ncbi:MAG: DUF2088 domain-containing protein [Planctomycetota bacterium]
MATSTLEPAPPALHAIHRNLSAAAIEDVPSEVHRQLDQLGVDPPRGPMAITAGSRGVANMAAILRAAGEWLRARGSEPFVIPSMGSHNGATAEGQRAMLEGLGMTEAALGMPIRSSMETVTIGEVATGPITMDRFAHESAGVLVVNRVKRHTGFGGPPFGGHCESGLAKMMTVGLGKIEAARTFHAASTTDKPNVIREMAERVVATGKLWAGLAILEDALDQTAELHALPAGEILSREPELLARHAERYFVGLPVDELNVLIIDQIGKNFSGTGMDTNVIGRRGLSDAPDLESPRIGSIAALSLSPESQGNAVGVGLADVVTQRLADAVNHEKTRLNAETAGAPNKAVLPLVLPDEDAVLAWLLERHGPTRWMRIANTLELERVWLSEDLLAEAQGR